MIGLQVNWGLILFATCWVRAVHVLNSGQRDMKGIVPKALQFRNKTPTPTQDGQEGTSLLPLGFMSGCDTQNDCSHFVILREVTWARPPPRGMESRATGRTSVMTVLSADHNEPCWVTTHPEASSPTMNFQCTREYSFSYHWRSLGSGFFLLPGHPDKAVGWEKASNIPQTYLMFITEKPQWRGREFFPLALRTQRLHGVPWMWPMRYHLQSSAGIWADAPRVMEQNGGLSGKWLFSLEKLL